uniref:Uncharacterized protein n=1 Tax=Plectus sambesii TaxID=2011161 RepID=A0A914XBA3_9BILA
TFLNDHKVAADVAHSLQDDDTLRFGHDPLQFRLVRMNSEDSLNQDAKGRSSPLVDISQQQGGEMVDSPRGSTGTSSPASMRREMSGAPMQQQPMMAPVMFDPSSGQQYYMPTQPQLLYQPVYLPAAPAGGIFYQPISAAHPPGAYFMPPQYMQQQQQQQQQLQQQQHAPVAQRYSSTPPSALASHQHPSTSSCTHCHLSTTTAGAGADSDAWSIRSDSGLPSNHHHHDHHDPDLHSNPESAISTPEHNKANNRYHQGANLEKEHGRTPLFGQPPSWWGEDERNNKLPPTSTEQSLDTTTAPRNDSKSPISSAVSSKAMPSHPDADRAAMSDTEAIRLRPSTSPPAGFGGRRSLKPVRMDFDFASAPSATKSAAAAKPAAATAFTVTFDSEKETLSLQDAARKSNSGRRMMRRSAPIPQRQEAPVIAPSTDPKEYLLNKMLHGDSAGRLLPQDNSVAEQKRDFDTLSDAGTYVIDNEEAKIYGDKPMMLSQVLDEESSTRTPSPVEEEEEEEEATPREEKPPRIPTDQTTKRDLLKELLKMSASPTNNPPSSSVSLTPTSSTPPNPAVRSRKDEFNRISAKTAVPTNRHSMATHQPAKPPPAPAPSAASASSASPFRRGDGGRFSMRAGPPMLPSRPSTTGGWKPPFRSGINSRPSVTKESDEMIAWLRRKDYNPMKAAAAAKKGKVVSNGKNDQFLSNRSISFHIGEGGPPPLKATNQKSPSVSRLSRNKSHEDGDQPEWNHVEEELLVSYSRGIVDDLKLMTASADDSHDAEYMAAVAQATNKLAKQSGQTIQLI